MKVAVSGGGTGGHTLPVIAVINSFSKSHPNTKVIFIGSKVGIESRLIPKMGIKYYGINSGKFRRYHRSMLLNIIDLTTLFKNIRDFFSFIKGISEARNILMHERPDVVFAKGGFVSFPVGIAARFLKIPLVVHESDLVMGLANKKMASFATKVCVSFPPKNFPEINPDKLVYTGNPVREDILSGRGEALKRFLGFSLERKTILVLGGSQGSQFINNTIFKVLENILDRYQLIWITGERDADWINYELKNNFPKEMQKYLRVYGFAGSELADIYDAADLVISRSGSNVLFELAALGKPPILIPLESSAGGHQYENARAFSRSGAAYIFRQGGFEPKKLLKHIDYLFSNEDELKKMTVKIGEWARTDAAGNVAKVIYEEGLKQVEQAAKSQKQE